MHPQPSREVFDAPPLADDDVRLPRATPIYFGPTDRSRAGWMHGVDAPSSTGVVICNPFGFEAISAHRTLRHLADSLARASMPTLRFDYDGTGDSAGDDGDSDRLAAWVQSTRDAIAALRQASGVDRVWLVGLRLGALIATLAAVGQRDVAGVVAIAPIVVGKTYLRELNAFQKTLELAEPPAGRVVPGGQETLGFEINAETRAALSAVNLGKLDERLGAAEAPFEVLVLERDDFPLADSWVTQLRAHGVLAEAKRVGGYLEMMVDPHKSVIPQLLVGEVVQWLSHRMSRAEPHARSPRIGANIRKEARFDGVLEGSVVIDEQRLLFGILSRPATAKASGRSIILLNAGSIHHVGPNRLHVRLARIWAAQGHEVLRLDITGIGESGVRSGQEENVVYSLYALEDVLAAVAYLRRRGAHDVRPVGLCSGAYFAMKGALATPDVAGFVAINPLTFESSLPESTDYPRVRTAREAARYWESVRDVAKWKKLLRGRVRFDALARTLGRYVVGRLEKHGRALARRLALPLENDVGAELVRLAERNVEQRFVFAGSDPGIELLRDEADAAVKKLVAEGRLRIDILEGTDHTFTARWAHDPLTDVLTAAIAPAKR